VDTLIGALVVTAGFAVLLAGYAALAVRMRRRRIGGALMGPIDEIYHPAAHRFRAEIQVHEQRTVPTPSPGAGSGRKPQP
jgi:hypothetical protein